MSPSRIRGTQTGSRLQKALLFATERTRDLETLPPGARVHVYGLHVQRIPQFTDIYVHEGETDEHEPATRRRFPLFRRHAWQTCLASATSPSVSRISHHDCRELTEKQDSCLIDTLRLRNY